MSLRLDLGRRDDGGIRLDEEWTTFAPFRKDEYENAEDHS